MIACSTDSRRSPMDKAMQQALEQVRARRMAERVDGLVARALEREKTVEVRKCANT